MTDIKYPKQEVMIVKLKKYFGWDDDMIAYIKLAKGLKLVYRIMLLEVSNETTRLQ